MSVDTLGTLLVYCSEYGLHLGVLALLAWGGERAMGVDAFHLVVAYLLGAATAVFSISTLGLPLFAGLGCAAVCACAVDLGFVSTMRGGDEPLTLLLVIIAATLAVTFFGYAFDYSPVSLLGFGVHWRWFCMLLAVVVLLGTWGLRKGQRLQNLRLGTSYRWALEYWDRPVSSWWPVVASCSLLGWLVVVGLPLFSNGVSNSRVLREVILAILIARVASARGVSMILILGVGFGIIEGVLWFLIANVYAQLMVELAVIILLVTWMRRRSARTSWRVVDVH